MVLQQFVFDMLLLLRPLAFVLLDNRRERYVLQMLLPQELKMKNKIKYELIIEVNKYKLFQYNFLITIFI